MRPLTAHLSLAALVAALLLPHSASAAEFYRYHNDAGHLVMDSRMPPEFIKNGYEVINEQGMVIRRVEAQATEAELAAKAEARAEEERRKKQQERDERLLVRYSSVSDIEAAQARIVDEIIVRVQILRGNLRSIKEQIAKQQERAANIERTGREAPQRLLENIAALEGELDDTSISIKARKSEIAAVKAEFAADSKRFEHLQALRYGSRSQSSR